MEVERPELVVPGVVFVLVGVFAAFTALTEFEPGFGFENPRNQYLVGAAAIFVGVFMLDRVYGWAGRD